MSLITVTPLHICCGTQAEEDLYYKSGKLVDFLKGWQGTASTIAGRMEELVIDLYERNYLEIQVCLAFFL